MAKTSGWIAALSAHTTADNREIEEKLVEELAETYDPNFYAARINLEHISWWKRFGDVIETKSKKENGIKKLFVRLKVNELLEEINAADQAVYLSVEFVRNFAGTGKAYLTGLALTDSPASIGTGRVSLNVEGENHNIEFINSGEVLSYESNSVQKKGLIAQIIQSFNNNKEKDMSSDTERLAEINKLKAKNKNLKQQLKAVKNKTVTEDADENTVAINKLTTDLEKLTKRFNKLKSGLETTIENFTRPPATGVNSETNETDDII